MSNLDAVEKDLRNQFSDSAVRRGFIRKVYLLLSSQLVVTFAIVSVFTFVTTVREFSAEHREVFWVALGLSVALMVTLQCCGKIRRKVPYNYILLGVFTLVEGYVLGAVSATYGVEEIAIAVGVTIAVVVTLTIFASQSKIDFTVYRGVACALTMVLFIFGLSTLIFRGSTMRLLYACGGHCSSASSSSSTPR